MVVTKSIHDKWFWLKVKTIITVTTVQWLNCMI